MSWKSIAFRTPSLCLRRCWFIAVTARSAIATPPSTNASRSRETKKTSLSTSRISSPRPNRNGRRLRWEITRDANAPGGWCRQPEPFHEINRFAVYICLQAISFNPNEPPSLNARKWKVSILYYSTLKHAHENEWFQVKKKNRFFFSNGLICHNSFWIIVNIYSQTKQDQHISLKAKKKRK